MADKPFQAYDGDGPYFFVSYAHGAERAYPETTRVEPQVAGMKKLADE